MTEPKRLTPEVLDLAFATTYVEGSGNGPMLDDIRAHIAAQAAEIAEAHELLRELTEDEEAGVYDDGEYSPECVYCGYQSGIAHKMPYPHAPDCPIVRGRALVKP